jgi:hypothetical protein
VSNLTCNPLSAVVFVMRAAMAATAPLRHQPREKFFAAASGLSSYVDDGTNDLMDLSVLRGIGAGKSSRQSRGEAPLHGLEGRTIEGGPAHGSAQRRLDPTTKGVSPSPFILNWPQ